MKKQGALLLIVVAGLFFVIDQLLKGVALEHMQTSYLVGRWFGWYPFLNPGIAFGIPLPQPLVLLVTMPILIFFLYRAYLAWCRAEWVRVGAAALVTCGAASNLLDRIMYHKTVDYFLLFTGVINVADVMIVVGFLIYLYAVRDQQA